VNGTIVDAADPPLSASAGLPTKKREDVATA